MKAWFCGDKCPVCCHVYGMLVHGHRLRRALWMRLILSAKRYRCPICGTEYLSVLKVYRFRLKRSRKLASHSRQQSFGRGKYGYQAEV